MMVRPARDADLDAILALDDAAFGGPEESRLVAALHRDGDIRLHLVAEEGGACAGHIVFSRLGTGAAALAASALAPLAVDPGRQRQGLGTRLVRAGLAALRAQGQDLVLVLGDPAFYGRFGFTAAAARPFPTAFDGPYLQALTLSKRGAGAQGPLAYPSAFADLA